MFSISITPKHIDMIQMGMNPLRVKAVNRIVLYVTELSSMTMLFTSTCKQNTTTLRYGNIVSYFILAFE